MEILDSHSYFIEELLMDLNRKALVLNATVKLILWQFWEVIKVRSLVAFYINLGLLEISKMMMLLSSRLVAKQYILKRKDRKRVFLTQAELIGYLVLTMRWLFRKIAIQECVTVIWEEHMKLLWEWIRLKEKSIWQEPMSFWSRKLKFIN